MIATICPGSIACAAGAVTWASTLPTATAMPSGRPVQAAACAVSAPARAPSGASGCSSLSATKSAKPRVERGQVVRGRVAAVLVDALVAGGADVAGLLAAQLPDDPVGRLDPALHAPRRPPGPPRAAAAPWRTPTRTRSCPRSAASHGSPRSAASALIRSACAWAAWCFHSFDVGVRPVGVAPAARTAACRRRSVGQHGAGGEVGADADRPRRVDPGRRDRGRGTAVRSTSR